MTPDQELSRLAARQHGLFITTHHALACGLSPARLHHRVTGGRFEHLASEVYRVDDALRRGLTTPDEVADRFVWLARRGRRGVGVLRPHLEHRLGTTGLRPGEFERRMWRLLDDAGVGRPVCGHEVRTVAGLFVAPVDLAYPPLRIAVECDSDQWHSGRQRRHADLDRQNVLVLAGWTVLRFTWDHLVLQPESIVDRVRRALVVAAAGVPA